MQRSFADSDIIATSFHLAVSSPRCLLVVSSQFDENRRSKPVLDYLAF